MISFIKIPEICVKMLQKCLFDIVASLDLDLWTFDLKI